MTKDIELQDLLDEGVSMKDAAMMLEAYYSSRIEGAKKMTPKDLIALITGGHNA
jgi:hypothetical protein